MTKQDFWKWIIGFLLLLYFGSWVKPLFDRGFEAGDLNSLIVGIILSYFFYKIFIEK